MTTCAEKDCIIKPLYGDKYCSWHRCNYPDCKKRAINLEGRCEWHLGMEPPKKKEQQLVHHALEQTEDSYESDHDHEDARCPGHRVSVAREVSNDERNPVVAP